MVMKHIVCHNVDHVLMYALRFLPFQSLNPRRL